MTGQAKEDVLLRFGELGVGIREGRLGFAPQLLHRSEFMATPYRFEYRTIGGTAASWDLPAGSLAFTCCQVPVCYQLGDRPSIRLERSDGGVEIVDGTELGPEASAAIASRNGTYRRLIATVAESALARG
jgi:hypothetical protein